MKLWVLFLCFCAACLLEEACSHSASNGGDTSSPVIIAVDVGQVISSDVTVTVTATGSTDVLRKQMIVAPVAGWIISLKTLEGSAVKRGSLMAQLRPKEAQAAITGAEAMLRAARTDAQRAAAQRAIALAESTQTSVDIYAGLEGIVATRTVAEGEFVAESNPLFTIIDPTSVVFFADVPLQDLPKIQSGQRATVTFAQLPGRDFPAVVEAITPQAESASQSVKVRLHLSPRSAIDRAMLRTGIIGTAHIVTGMHHHALVIPRAALIRNTENDHYSVMIVGADSLAHTVPVTVGFLADSLVEVSGDLHPGTAVITSGGYALADSSRVTLAPNSPQ